MRKSAAVRMCPNCGEMLITDHGDFLTVVYCLDCDFEKEEYIGPTPGSSSTAP